VKGRFDLGEDLVAERLGQVDAGDLRPQRPGQAAHGDMAVGLGVF
jgi:hypothetical protein